MSEIPPFPEPRILPRSKHPISRAQIDSDALSILYRLHRAGFDGHVSVIAEGRFRHVLELKNPPLYPPRYKRVPCNSAGLRADASGF